MSKIGFAVLASAIMASISRCFMGAEREQCVYLWVYLWERDKSSCRKRFSSVPAILVRTCSNCSGKHRIRDNNGSHAANKRKLHSADIQHNAAIRAAVSGL